MTPSFLRYPTLHLPYTCNLYLLCPLALHLCHLVHYRSQNKKKQRFSTIFLLNLANEIDEILNFNKSKINPRDLSCSDILVSIDENKIISGFFLKNTKKK